MLYVDGGAVLTSAGIACGIDLCLHIVRSDLGAAAANRLARLIVAAPHRDGGQSQFIEAPVGTGSGSLAPTRAWALDRLGEPLTVRDLARHAGVSERTFARRFVDETGQSPLQWLLGARIQVPRELVESTDLVRRPGRRALRPRHGRATCGCTSGVSWGRRRPRTGAPSPPEPHPDGTATTASSLVLLPPVADSTSWPFVTCTVTVLVCQ